MTAPRAASPRTGPGRRAVLLGGGLTAGAAGASAVWAPTGPSAAAPIPAPPGIPPDDDLMREHGVLKRVLLCYREMTRRIQVGDQVAAPDLHDSPGTRARLAEAMQAFVRMYEPHEAREDTVIFPAFRQAVPAAELASLGQHFADLERQQFGRDEFGAMVARVARIEQDLDIYDLDQFTPQVGPFSPSA